ncbi:general amino acid permease [Melanogaster broomeanus]|nr:general amino acid permease [Melanogaster broomeanus]
MTEDDAHSPTREKFTSSVPAGEFVYRRNLDHVKRQLGRQHIQMSLVGTIGTGLFLGLGEILTVCGPLGSLIVYIHVSTVIYATIISVGEMTAYAPISGSLLHYAARWLDPAVGFAVTRLGSCVTVTSVASAHLLAKFNTELFLCRFLDLFLSPCLTRYRPLPLPYLSRLLRCLRWFTFWDVNPDHTAIYIAVTMVALFFLNLFGVRWFGNSEIVFATLKIMLVVGLIIGGLTVSLGGGPDHEVIGFRYWRDPGPMVSTLEPGAMGRFLGLLVAIAPAAFSVSGIELIAVTAAEAQQPRTNIIKAMKTVIFRLIVFYICSVIVVGMLVPSNDPSLFQPGASAGQSPFVIAFTRAGIKVLPSIINAILITSAFSAANTYIFTSSRILYGLAVQNQAPKIFTTCTKSGMPWVAVIVAWLFSFLAFMTISTSSGTVFNWFLSLSVVCGLLGWLTINTTYLRYYYGLRLQGVVPHGIYRSSLQPYASMWAIFWIIFYILVSGISVFWDWNTSQFIASYINLPVFFCLLVGYKFWYKTKIAPLADLDFVSNLPSLEDTGDAGLLLEKRSVLKRLKQII